MFGGIVDEHEGDGHEENHHVLRGRVFGDGSRMISREVVGGDGRARLDVSEDKCQIEHVRSGSAVFSLVVCKYDMGVGKVCASRLSF